MKSKTNQIAIFVVLLVILLTTLACGSSNKGTLVTTAPTEAGKQAEPTKESIKEPTKEPTKDVYAVGELIKVSDHTIRLNSLKYQSSKIIANFTIENLGTSDLNVSSMVSFSAKKEDGTKLDQDIFDCGTSSLDGTVLSGDKLRGDICWSGATPADGAKIYYSSSLFGQGAVVWKAIEGESQPVDSGNATSPTIVTYKVGDLVEVQNHTIRLNSLEYRGNLLVTNFSVENKGDKDIHLSSMMSFSAKTNDGTKLETELFDCTESSIDGKVLPGDRLTGNLCWKGANPDSGIKLYYEASMLGEGAIVWEAIAGVADPIKWTDAILKVPVAKIGDVVQVNTHTISLNSASITGNTLKANFTLENKGAEDLNVSSLMSFSARRRDGTALQGEFYPCGTSLDGKVIPGDKLKGDVCWKGAKLEDGIKIYYVDELLSEGAVVWKVE